MSYRKVPLCRCAVCGEEEIAVEYQPPIPIQVATPPGWYLPYGWSGSTRKHGDCFCEKCTKAIKRMKEE